MKIDSTLSAVATDVAQSFSLEQFAEAMAAAAGGHSAGRIVIAMGSPSE